MSTYYDMVKEEYYVGVDSAHGTPPRPNSYDVLNTVFCDGRLEKEYNLEMIRDNIKEIS